MTLTFNSVIDLSHALASGIPVWPGDPEVEVETIATVERDGYFVQRLQLGEHAGTHFGAPAHLHASEMCAESELAASSFIHRGVKIDVRTRCADDRDYRLTLDDFLAYEHRNGRVRADSVLLLETGWSGRWRDRNDYFGFDDNGVMHFPGFALETARFLAEERGVIGLGIDTAGIDAGNDVELSVNTYWLHERHFHIENLTNLSALPKRGFTLVIGVMKIAKSSGGPARVMGLV